MSTIPKDQEEIEMAAFAQAMMAAGYQKPDRSHRRKSQFLYQRDQDRFVGWQLARESRPEHQHQGKPAPAHVDNGQAEPRWLVNATYVRSNQRFSSHYGGESALEAQIACQLACLADFGETTKVAINSVIDRTTGTLVVEESTDGDCELEGFPGMVEKLLQLAAGKLGEPPDGLDIQTAEEYDLDLRALEFWRSIISVEAAREMLECMYFEHDPAYDEIATACFTDSRGVTDGIDVIDALQRLVKFAEFGLGHNLSEPGTIPKETGVFQVLQAKLTLRYFEERLGLVLNQFDVSALDEHDPQGGTNRPQPAMKS